MDTGRRGPREARPGRAAWRTTRPSGEPPWREIVGSSTMSLGDGRDVAIDLGTANTLVYVRGQGIVMSEPSVIAVDVTTDEVHAVGRDAQRMIGRTPATISAVRPLRHGVIADFATTEKMLRYFLRRAHNRRFGRTRVVMCARGGITKVEQRAVEEASLSAGPSPGG